MTKAKDISARLPSARPGNGEHGFEKGCKPGPGRPKGSVDRLGREIKVALQGGRTTGTDLSATTPNHAGRLPHPNVLGNKGDKRLSTNLIEPNGYHGEKAAPNRYRCAVGA
jgi:hypothetical protein